MNRRKFVKKAALATAGVYAIPYLLPSGRLFAATGTRLVNHVVLCMYAGGMRNIEGWQKAEGNLMPNMFAGNENISSDILPGLDAVPSPVLTSPLENFGTLFKEMRYGSGPAGHFQGHTTVITGAYTDYNIKFDQPTAHATLFEYYRRHNSPQQTARKCWWVSNGLGENEHLSYSSDQDYGAQYAANFFSPNYVIPWGNYEPIDLCRTFSTLQKQKIDSVRDYLNKSFNHPPVTENPGFNNTKLDRGDIQNFITQMINEQKNGLYNNPWNVPGYMSSDMYNVFFAEKILAQFTPELLVVNMTSIDNAHSDFTDYCNNIRKADYAVGHLWNTIQNTPGLMDDTILIVVPEIGRNLQHNSIVDQYGRYGLDHGDDDTSKEIFCMVAGPQGKVYQGTKIDTVEGQSIDVVPTVAHILGFYNDIPGGKLTGTPLLQSFI